MAEMQQIHALLEQREKQILEEASQFAKEIARKELALLEFELFYDVMITDADKEKAEKTIKKLRQEKWKNALEKANGDEEKAIIRSL